MVEHELERTYLLKELPAGIAAWRSEVISDAFIPAQAVHPVVRLRQRGERYEITKKQPVDDKDVSQQEEHTIQLSKEEFDALSTVTAKRFMKRRFYGDIAGAKAEVDIYLEDLAGLVVVDFEFQSEETMRAFPQPSICLAEVTQDELIAGGMLAGKAYAAISPNLEKYHYLPLKTENLS